MKITQENITVESNYNLVNFKIDVSNEETLARLFQSLIFIYKDPFSFVREITQNSYDAVVELWEKNYKNDISLDDFLIKNPIIVSLVDAKDFYILEIKESHGIGISKDRMQNIFQFVSKSSKRDSDVQIGEKGIGKLSPLAYTNSYFINTIHDNINYNYKISWYDKSKVPSVSLLSESPTDSLSGTSIVVNIKKSDLKLLEQSIVKFLSYFNNIYYKGFFSKIAVSESKFLYRSFNIRNYSTFGEYFFSNTDFNDNKLYDFKSFIRRERIFPFNNESLHLCIDRIPYEIDSGLFHERISFPIGLKFKSNELLLNDNRDNIRYLECDGINKIKAKLKEAMDEIMSYRNDKRYFPNISDNLNNFYMNIDSLNHFKLGDEVFKMPFNQACFDNVLKDHVSDISNDYNNIFNNPYAVVYYYDSKNNNKRYYPVNSRIDFVQCINKRTSYQKINKQHISNIFKTCKFLIKDIDISKVKLNVPKDAILIDPKFNVDILKVFKPESWDIVKKYFDDFLYSKFELASDYAIKEKVKANKKNNEELTVYTLDISDVKRREIIKNSKLDKFILFKEREYYLAKRFNILIRALKLDYKCSVVSDTTYYKNSQYSYVNILDTISFKKVVSCFLILNDKNIRNILSLYGNFSEYNLQSSKAIYSTLYSDAPFCQELLSIMNDLSNLIYHFSNYSSNILSDILYDTLKADNAKLITYDYNNCYSRLKVISDDIIKNYSKLRLINYYKLDSDLNNTNTAKELVNLILNEHSKSISDTN